MEPEAPPTLEIESPRVGVRPHALVRRLTRSTFAIAMFAFIASLVATVFLPEGAKPPGWFQIPLGLSFMAAIATAAGALVAQVACWVTPLGRGRLAVDQAGIRVDGVRSRVIPRAQVETGWLLHVPDGSRLELRLRNGDVLSAASASPEEATAVLDAAGVDATRRALRMPLGGALASLGLGAAVAVPASCASSIVAVAAQSLLGLSSVSMGFLIFALFTALVAAGVRLLSAPVVSVGRDGLSVTGARGSWFVTFEEIDAVVHGSGDITLRLRDGQLRRIVAFGTSEARRQALVARIAAGVGAARSPEALSVRLTALDRNGRPMEEWRAALRALADASDGYRATGLSRDEVRTALEDPHTPPERRIGAAFALAVMDPAEAGQRVRVVADGVAHEPVRLALERAAAGEIDEEGVAAANEGRLR